MTVELVGKWPKELQSPISKIVEVLNSHKELDFPDAAINIMLVDDKEIARLNEEYSGNAYPTDVLTFAYGEEGIEDGELADIAISLDTAQKQAETAGVDLADEIALLSLHGILHSIGYDHQSDEEETEVERLQQEIMEAAHLKYRKFDWKH